MHVNRVPAFEFGGGGGGVERRIGVMARGEFLPSVPTLGNAGRGGQLAPCFVLELEENAASIPGLADSLPGGIAGPVVKLPPGAGALGALRRAPWIVQPDWRNTLTVSLPRDAFAAHEAVEQSR